MALQIVRSSKTRIADMNLIYGVEGIGKSTWAAGAPSPLFMDAEWRLGHLDVDCVPCVCAADAFGVVKEFPSDTHRSLAVDTADALNALFEAAICKENHWDNIESPGYGKGFAPLANMWLKFVDALTPLRAAGVEVNIVAHAVVKMFSNPAGDDYERYIPELPKKVSALLKARCSNIFFAHYEDVAAKSKGALKAKGASTGRRIMETCHMAAWDAKNSYDLIGPLDLNYSKFNEARNAWLAQQSPGRPATPPKVDAQVPATSPPADVSAPAHTVASVTALLKAWMAKTEERPVVAATRFFPASVKQIKTATQTELDQIAAAVGKEL